MWELVRANQRRAATLVVVMAALLFLLGYTLAEALAPGAGAGGLFIAFLVWVGLTLVSYYQGDSIFLALARARRIEKRDHPVLFNVVEEMSIAAGLPKVPDVYIVDEAAPNAFATGRDPQHAVVAVTAGLLETLDRDELQGVVAHELGHVANRDVLYMMMVGVMMGTIVLLADFGGRAFFWGGGRRRTSSRSGGEAQLIILVVAVVLMILAPVIAQLIYLAISRRREYLADASSAMYTRYPDGLASALEKMSRSTARLTRRDARHGADVHRQPPRGEPAGPRRPLEHAPADLRADPHPALHGSRCRLEELRRGVPEGDREAGGRGPVPGAGFSRAAELGPAGRTAGGEPAGASAADDRHALAAERVHVRRVRLWHNAQVSGRVSGA